MPVLLLFVLSAVVIISWFRSGMIIYFWDATFPLRPDLALVRYSSVWDNTVGLGHADIAGFKLLPYLGFIYALNSIFHLPLFVAQALMYLALLFGAGYGMYSLIRTIASSVFRRENAKFLTIAALSSALLYMFNLYSILFLWRIFSTNTFMYVALPYFFVLAIRFLRTGPTPKLVLAGVLISLVASVSNPALFLPLGLLLGSFIMLLAMGKISEPTGRFNWKPLLVLVIIIGANVYWIVPTIVLLRNLAFPTSSLYGGTISALQFNSQFANLFDVATLRGQQVLYEQYNGEYDYSWVSLYHSGDPTGLWVISILIPVFAYISTVRYRNSGLLFFGAFTLVFGLLAKGAHDPFGELYTWGFQAAPQLAAFRDPYSKFGLFYLFCLSIVFGVGVGVTSEELHRRAGVGRWVIQKHVHKIIPLLILFLVCGLYMWPFWTGDAIPSGTTIRPSARVDIPDSYYRATEYLLNQSRYEDFRTLLLPFQSSPLQSSLWQYGYVGFPIIRSLTYKPVIFGITGSTLGDRLSVAIAQGIGQNSSNVYNLLSNLNVKYVMVDESTNVNFDPLAARYPEIETFLNHSSRVQVVKRFDYLLLYQMNLFQPLFSATTQFQTLMPNMNKTIIALSDIQRGFGQGYVSAGQNSLAALCQVRNSSDYCNFELQGLSYNIDNLPYVAASFRSIGDGSLSISFSDGYGTSYWPSAEDAASTRYNIYASPTPITISYNLGSLFISSLSAIHLHVNPEPSTPPNTVIGINFTSLYLAATPPQLTPESNLSLLLIRDIARNPVVIADEASLLNQPGPLGSSPALEVRILTSDSYVIHVVNATSPFYLIFDQTYDASWIASSPDSPSANYVHYQANDFQNAWNIDRSGSFDVTVHYAPQSSIDSSALLGAILSIGLVGGSVAIQYKIELGKLYGRAKSKVMTIFRVISERLGDRAP